MASLLPKTRTIDPFAFRVTTSKLAAVSSFASSFASSHAHSFRLHSPKCEKCKQPIAPQPGQKEAMRIIALDKSFCKPCFVCSNASCSINLSDTKAGGCYPVNNDFYCKTCSISAINQTVMAS